MENFPFLGQDQVAALLIIFYAEVNAANYRQSTPLLDAVQNGE